MGTELVFVYNNKRYDSRGDENTLLCVTDAMSELENLERHYLEDRMDIREELQHGKGEILPLVTE